MPDSNQSEVVFVNCEGCSAPLPPSSMAYSIEGQTVQIKLRRNIGYLVHGSQFKCFFQKNVI